ncbi:MAG: PQQ-like beta-propeller repeat protein [Verrucomicrobiae bacterium]|nr:PQQ-like beta-propeller repeat protein [Verrucomicrobiae bacterium]
MVEILKVFRTISMGLAAMALQMSTFAADSEEDQWPQWRGPTGQGISLKAEPPLEWAEDKNVAWKVALPGKGHSTPIIWGERVFVTAAIPVGDAQAPVYDQAEGSHDNAPVRHHYEFVIICLNRTDGKEMWRTTVAKAFPHEGGHVSGSLASNSPVTDGQRVYAFFGSRGLHCLDFEGKLVWTKDLGQMHTRHAHGEGASPILAAGNVVVNWDHEQQSFIVAIDKTTGIEKWRTNRDEPTSWSTPLLIEHQGAEQIVVNATNRIRAYDPKTGAEIWQCGGMSRNVIASPLFADGVVFAGSSYDTRAMVAIQIEGAKGDITDSDHLIWQRNKRTPYVPSPLLYKGTLYTLGHYQAILSCIDPKTGEDMAGPFRLPGVQSFYASPVAAAGRIYLADLDGATMVLQHGESPEPLAVNQLDDTFSATPALAGKDLFLRGERSLYCIRVKE